EGDKEAMMEWRKARRDALKAMRDARKDLRAAHEEAARKFLGDEETTKKVRESLNKRRMEQKKDRPARVNEAREKLKAELGEKADHPPVRQELLRHAWRVARLERLIAIAEAAGKQELLERA